MSTDLRDAFHRAATAVPPMGDAERAVRSARRRRRAATVAAPLAVLAVVGGVWFVGAGSPGEDQPPAADSSPSPVTAGDLAGRTFVTTDGPADQAPVMLVFGTTELTVTVSPSSNTTDYRIDEGVLVLERATFVCAGPACISDLPDLLYSRPIVTLSGAELTLSGPKHAVTMTESDLTEAEATLTGWTWLLESYSARGDRSESVAVPEGVRSTLEFEPGFLGVDYGCNTGGGNVRITSSTIVLGQIGTTAIRCEPTKMKVERVVRQVLWEDDGVLSYVVEGDALILTVDRAELVYR